MPGRPSRPKPIKYIGAIVALTALVGYVFFDWRFGEANGTLPFAIGFICVILAVGWMLYQRP
jgi:hypothetical protein